MTNKLYEKNSYLKEYKTTVTACIREGDSVYIKLADSIFFPEEGGQYSDRGTITSEDREIRILKGQLLGSPTEGETDIRYLVDGEIETGTEVLCKLDWGLRFSRMQNHSGEHILSGLIHERFGLNNTGFHLSDEEPVTLAFDGLISEEQVSLIEREANEVIFQNLPIRDSYPSKSELEAISYRSKLDIKAQVRLITIGDESRTVDVCACCAPHVSHTGAIGFIKIISAIKFKGGTRLSILCGKRAFDYINENLDLLEKTCKVFSTNPADLPRIADKCREENQVLAAKTASLTEQLILKDIGSGAYKNCVITGMDLSPVNMKNIYNLLVSIREKACGVFVGSDEEGYRYYAGIKDGDARLLAQRMKEALNAKGGGSPEMIQGKCAATKEEIDLFFNP